MAPVLKVLTIGLNGLFLENRIIKYTLHYVVDSDFGKIKFPKWNFKKVYFRHESNEKKKLASHFKSKVFFYRLVPISCVEKVIYTLK